VGDQQIKVVVTEPIDFGLGTPSSFSARLRVWAYHFDSNPRIQEVCENKAWYGEFPYRMALDQKWEGIVCVSPSTYPSTAEHLPLRSRQARYVKFRLTEDIRIRDSVWEVDYVTRAPIRPRYDKKKPNSDDDRVMLQEAVPHSVVWAIMAPVSPADPLLVARVLSWVAGGRHGPNPSSLTSLQMLKCRYEDIIGEFSAAECDAWSQVVREPSLLLGVNDTLPGGDGLSEFDL